MGSEDMPILDKNESDLADKAPVLNGSHLASGILELSCSFRPTRGYHRVNPGSSRLS